MKNDPGAAKYQSSFESLVQKIASVPKEDVEALEAQKPRGVKTRRRRKVKAKK